MSAIMNQKVNEELECCICYEIIGEQNNCTTPCGHKFCFVCMMKTLEKNNTCPCCRAVLQEKKEDEEEEEDIPDLDDDEYSDEEDELDYHDRSITASTKNIASELESLGYTMSDILTLYLGRMNPAGERTSATFVEKLSEDFNQILNKQDSEIESEHYEKFDMMDEDTRRHNRRVPSALDIDSCVINLTTLFEN
jgi:hypothetical protein